jgi:diacylglycerol diphosphate phosphatase / phosphatidate phosphatase
MSRRPTFGQWLKGTWLDIVTMACMGAIGLGVSSYPFKNPITSLTIF